MSTDQNRRQQSSFFRAVFEVSAVVMEEVVVQRLEELWLKRAEERLLKGKKIIRGCLKGDKGWRNEGLNPADLQQPQSWQSRSQAVEIWNIIVWSWNAADFIMKDFQSSTD